MLGFYVRNDFDKYQNSSEFDDHSYYHYCKMILTVDGTFFITLNGQKERLRNRNVQTKKKKQEEVKEDGSLSTNMNSKCVKTKRKAAERTELNMISKDKSLVTDSRAQPLLLTYHAIMSI